MNPSKKGGVEGTGPARSPQKKEQLSPLSERIKPLLVRSARCERSISHYALHDIEKAIDLAG